MARPSFSDELYQGFGNAVADIREKFEESVWGRAVTEPGGESPHWPQAHEPEPSFGSLTRTIDVGPTIGQNGPQWPQAQDQNHGQPPEQNRDIDLDR